MCDHGTFKLCTCDAEALQQHGPDELIWTLRRSHGAHLHRRGRVKRPVSDLRGILSSEWVEHQLNDRNCFDFDFQPQASDWLTMRFPLPGNATSGPYEYLSFVFEDGAWRRNRRLGLRHEIEILRRGVVEFRDGIPAEAAPPPPETFDGFCSRLSAAGAVISPFALAMDDGKARAMPFGNGITWKLFCYKGMSLNPNHGRSQAYLEYLDLIGWRVDILPGGLHVEWAKHWLKQANCLEDDRLPQRGDLLYFVHGLGTPEASHFVFRRWDSGWEIEKYPQDNARFVHALVAGGNIVAGESLPKSPQE